MSKKEKEQVDDLHSKMQSLRSRRVHAPADSRVSKDLETFLETIQETVDPIVNSFVQGDRSLIVQSRDLKHIFISYGYHQVCKLSTSASLSSVSIALQSDAGTEHVYNGAMDKDQIQKAVQDALLRWYARLS